EADRRHRAGDPDRQSRARHSAHGGLSARRLALPRLPSRLADGGGQVGADGRGADGMTGMQRADLLHPDAVLNTAMSRPGNPQAPGTLEEFEILPEAPAALRALDEADFLLIVVTNQPDVARGMVGREVVEAMHRKLLEALPIDAIKACYEIDGPASTCY